MSTRPRVPQIGGNSRGPALQGPFGPRPVLRRMYAGARPVRIANGSGRHMRARQVILGSAALMALVLAGAGGYASGRTSSTASAANSAADAAQAIRFGPFLLDSSFAEPSDDAVNPGELFASQDVATLTSSNLWVRLPHATLSSVSALATSGELSEIRSEWKADSGATFRLDVRHVASEQLPVAIRLTPQQSHLLLHESMIDGRYAVVSWLTTCGKVKGGYAAVWLDGALLTLSSPDSDPREPEALLSSTTLPGAAVATIREGLDQ